MQKKPKTLILGLDGLGKETLSAYRLENLAHLLRSGQTFEPKVDNVLSRGWPEIYTGVTAEQSGAYFQIPTISNERIRPSQKTGSNRVAAHLGEENLLWNSLGRRGRRVGLFTVPTVNQAQTKIEFSFPATGGGIFGSSISGLGISPSHLSRLAISSSENLGFRLGRQGFLPKDELSLDAWLRDHIHQFFSTLRQFILHTEVDVLFCASRFLTTYYSFRHVLSNPADHHDELVGEVLLAAAADFDLMLRDFVEWFDPTQTFVVSDHGIGEHHSRVDLNWLLMEANQLSAPSPGLFKAKRAISEWKNSALYGPHGHQYRYRYGLEKARAFSIGYTDAIYLNDSRFLGEFLPDEDRWLEAEELAKRLQKIVVDNSLDEVEEIIPIRGPGLTAPHVDHAEAVPIPDLRIRLAEGVTNLGHTGTAFGQAVVPRGSRAMFKNGFEDQHSGSKSDDTLAGYIGPENSKMNVGKLPDLFRLIDQLA